jgi:Ca-activated chloride channel family protein
MTHAVGDSDAGFEKASQNLRFAAAVAELGMLLRDSEYKGAATYDQMIALAEGARGEDRSGRKSEFVFLAKTARGLAGGEQAPRLGAP